MGNRLVCLYWVGIYSKINRNYSYLARLRPCGGKPFNIHSQNWDSEWRVLMSGNFEEGVLARFSEVNKKRPLIGDIYD
jgi:hypothetical protein